jgi:tRNA-dihydrouridine synthase B
MNIGSLSLENKLILAPLAGITNLPFRLLAKEAGCGLVCSEMISSNGLVHESKKTVKLLDSALAEKPVSFQIFGADPFVMAEAAGMIEAAGADIVDINFGCSVKKILKTGAGAALMKAPEKAQAIIRSVRRAVKIPLTIKMRSGWDDSGMQAVELARIAEANGADAITVHPRTAAQGFTGTADWSRISAVKKAVSIPVIGNGDIASPDDAERMLNETQCDGIMVGRAAIGNPLLLTQIKARLCQDAEPQFNEGRRFEAMRRYLNASVGYIGEIHACRMMRSRLGWFVKGLPNSSRFRIAIRHLSSRSEALELIDLFELSLEQNQLKN